MKKKINLILLAAISLLFVSCGNKPEDVVTNYYTHFLKGEFDEAKKYVVEEHQGLCDLMKNFTSDEDKAKMAKTEITVSNIECQITDDTTAICTCQIKTSYEEEEKNMDESVKLKKIGKDWYINQGKESGDDNAEITEEIPASTAEEEILNEDSTNATVENSEI